MFVAANQQPPGVGNPTFLVRSQSDAPIAAAVRQAIMSVDANAPLTSIRTAGERLAPLTAQDRAIARLALAFGLVALAPGGNWLYGVLSYGVARRTSEIAVRIALGARPSRVMAMILRETAGVVLIGVADRRRARVSASRLIASTLFGVAPRTRRHSRGDGRAAGGCRVRRLPAGTPGVEARADCGAARGIAGLRQSPIISLDSPFTPVR